MELITFEHETFKALVFEIYESRKLTQAMFDKMSDTTQDRWLSPKEAADYTGFNQAWIKARSAKIGAFQDGKGLRFKQSDIDKYMQANSFKAK
jgi:ATP-dependent protease ClpP protease subunit